MSVARAIVPRTSKHLAGCADLARMIHRVDGYPTVLQDDIDEFLMPPSLRGAWICAMDGIVVGHVALHDLTSPELADLLTDVANIRPSRVGMVSRLMVHPEDRGLGVGRALLDTATVEAWSRDLHPALEVVTSYVTAISLYEQAGWRRVGVVRVPMPNGSDIAEFVYLGPDPAHPIRPT